MAPDDWSLTPAALRELLTREEGENLEFKPESEKVGDLAETFMSFANAAGGIVLVGVSDEQQLLGVRQRKVTHDRIYSAARQVTPSLVDEITVQPVVLEGRFVLAVRVPGDLRGTYAVSGLYRRRVGSFNVAMSPAEVAAHMSRRGLVSLDGWPVRQATPSDLDPGQVDAFLRRRYGLVAGQPLPTEVATWSLEQRLDNLGLLVDGHPVVAAVLMFGTQPQRLLPHSEVQCARFLGATTSRFLDRDYLHGSVPDLVEAATAFIRRNTHQGLVILPTDSVAVEQPEYPPVAVREALTNAVVHREYLTAHAAVRVLIFADRLEIVSPGGLLPGLDITHLAGQTALRNRTLAELLHTAGYIERFGTGIARMQEAMSAAGLPLPILASTETTFTVTLRNARTSPRPAPAATNTAPALPSGVASLPATVLVQLNRDQIQAYHVAVTVGRITVRDYCAITGRQPDVARRELRTLVALGLLLMQGQGRGVHYVPQAQ